MLTIRLLLSDLKGATFESETQVVLDRSIESRLTNICKGLIAEHFVVLRIDMLVPFMPIMQRYLIPSVEGCVTTRPRIPVA